ncbi:PepSY-associated TM helix domain-containing protein [Saccharopolyspora griseoalba]|uniref:PepSY-associated TM helix domain-containing protein n=1 Tax=Saccharopolyspora griseoalba TaxID=1431848 RepID=A0ABW2LIH1_9PSEU
MAIDEAGLAPEHAPPRTGWWAQLRPMLLRLHFFAGVLVGPFLLVAACTGLLYVFTPQLEQLVYDRELHVPASSAHQPLAAQVDVAERALPGAELKAVRPGPTATDTTQVIFHAPDLPSSYYRTAFVDPHTGELRGVLQTYGSGQALPLRTWFDQLHRNLHLGEPGRLYSELAASWLWVVVLGGVALWLGRRRSRLAELVTPKLRPAGRQRVLSWHGSVGLCAALGLLFLSATGLTWSTYAGANIGELRSALSWETPAVPTDVPHLGGGDVGIDRAAATAEAHGLSGPLEITPPGDGAYQVQEIGRSWPTQQDAIAVHPATGEITAALPFADHPLMAKLSRWGIDAHMGLLFGWVNQLVLAAVALALICAVVWGYRMWWLRRPSRGFGRAPAGRPWSQVPARILVPAAVLALGLAWALPLFGIPLLVFLIADTVAGAIAGQAVRR